MTESKPSRGALAAFSSNDLDVVLRHVWDTLELAVRDRTHPMHTPVLATVRDGRAEARVVVLRAQDAAAGRLRVHTDSRSWKVSDIEAAPSVTVLGFDATAKLQIRIRGDARVHTDDSLAQDAWDRSRPFSLHCYHQVEAPGIPVAEPPRAVRPEQGRERERGRDNFAVIVIEAREIEWLYLDAAGHRRAIFRRNTEHKAWQGHWTAP